MVVPAPAICRRALLTLLIVAVTSGSPLQADDGSPLRYQWEKDRAYAWEITVTVEAGDTITTLRGNPVLTVKDSNDDGATLRFSGLLSESTKQKPAAQRGPIRRFPRRPRFSSIRPDMLDRAGHEIRVNDRGEIVSSKGNAQLPWLLGSISDLLLIEFDEGEEKSWEATDDTAITVSPASRIPSPFRRQEGERLKAEEKTRYWLKEQVGKTASIRREYSLRTTATVGGEPRIEFTTTGTVLFDTEQGVPVSLDLKGEIVSRSENVVVRRPMTIRHRLLDEAEMKKVRDAKLWGDKSLNAEDVEKLAEDLQSDEKVRILRGIGTATRKGPETPSPDVSRLLIELVHRDDTTISRLSAKALENWATGEIVDDLLKLLESDDLSTRWSVIKALGRTRSADVIAPLAQRLSHQQDRNAASAALHLIGPAAQAAVLAQLSAEDMFARREACRILGEIGDADSLDALRETAKSDGSPLVKQAAAQAIKAIEKRTSEPVI